MNRKALLATAFLALMLLSAAPPPATASGALNSVTNGPLVATISGNSLVANSSTHQYLVVASGGVSGNYSFTAYVTAGNSTGLSITPASGTSAIGRFYTNVTAGTHAEVVTLNVNITIGSGSLQSNTTKQFLIDVVNPVVITIPVENEGGSGVANANVSLFVNNELIQSKNVTLAAGQTTNVTFVWVAYHYPTGRVTATAVISSNGQLLFSNGASETSFPIYIPGSSENTIDGYIIIACFAAAVALFFVFFRKPKPRF